VRSTARNSGSEPLSDSPFNNGARGYRGDLAAHRPAWPNAAERFLDHLEDALHLIADHPKVGRERIELGGARGYSVAPHILVYRLDEERRLVDLIRVLDGRRDIAALFGL
jgi:plasmid stabilization system protein ParE